MSRSGGLGTTLGVPGRVSVLSVEPTGDCFYDCLHELLPPERAPGLASPEAMRQLVSDSLTEETFGLYQMYAQAGVEDFAWMRHHRAPRTLAELRDFANRSGKEHGAGQVLWADEHAIQTLATAMGGTILIVDEQATSIKGSRSGRRRAGADDGRPDGRFVAVGGLRERGVILHRSRRQHFSPVLVDAHGWLILRELPPAMRKLWPLLQEDSATSELAPRTVPRDTGNKDNATPSKRQRV